MVGASYSNIKPGEVCYIVVKTPSDSNEYLEAQFTGVCQEGDLAWKKIKKKGYHGAKAVQAVVTDPAVGRRGKDPIVLGQEPFRDYEVISRREYVNRMQREISSLKKELADNRRYFSSTNEDLLRIIDNAENRAAFENLHQENQQLQQTARNLPWAYLTIGAVFGIAACLGAAAYMNHRDASEVKSLEIRVEQP